MISALLTTTKTARQNRMDKIHDVLATTQTNRTARQQAVTDLLSLTGRSNNLLKQKIISLLENEDVKNAYKDAQKQRQDIIDNSKRFNVFTIIKSSYNEEFHSRIIAWLLDSENEHGLQEIPMRLFLKMLKAINKNLSIDEKSFDRAKIKCEANADGRRIDILITNWSL